MGMDMTNTLLARAKDLDGRVDRLSAVSVLALSRHPQRAGVAN